METQVQKVQKVLVHLSGGNAAAQCARFVQSITGHFGGQDETQVGCYLDNNRFILSQGAGQRVPLKRPAFCPFKHLSVTQAAAIPLDVQDRGVDVGVAVILQTTNQRVLLTRRAAGLRIFPGLWVPPGGHVELEETLVAAGLRELHEETGLEVEQNDVSPQILGLWESAYPARLARGSPFRHHIVTYMLLHCPHTHQELQVCLRPDPAEVSACLWVDRDLARSIVGGADGEEGGLQPPPPPVVRVTEVLPDGALRGSLLPGAVLCARAPAEGPDVERVSTGTKYALGLWLDSLAPRQSSSTAGGSC
ncbi:m7GpppN-mRNA hydrolase NUDT17 isoform X1 [Gadus morhua]|uniref:m7GpppN-mRNA hydrolase NUDT17 isoform X1 n=1 Tax=Gadus morhua TaxID=8049 RepID=UPI0011B69320|nr:nucleoside diphosphate-linked moiety X motif 17-like isoform X1 [Gadus morhua]